MTSPISPEGTVPGGHSPLPWFPWQVNNFWTVQSSSRWVAEVRSYKDGPTVSDLEEAKANAAYIVQAANTLPALKQRVEELESLLSLVLKYRRGIGKFNFSGLSDDQRANAAYDAWCEVETKIEQALTPKDKATE